MPAGAEFTIASPHWGSYRATGVQIGIAICRPHALKSSPRDFLSTRLLRDETRYAMACELLSSHLPVAEVSDRLGYESHGIHVRVSSLGSHAAVEMAEAGEPARR